MAKGLARSLEWAGMLLPRAVVTNRTATELKDFYHHVIVDSTLPNSYHAKLRTVDLSPFDDMIFIDVDCLVYEKFSLPASATPFIAFGEDVKDSDWYGVTLDFVRSLDPRVRNYSVFHTGLFQARKSAESTAMFKQALELESVIQRQTGKAKLVPDEILVSVSAAIHGLTDFWPKDESVLSPSTLWSRPPRLDIRRRTAPTCCRGRWTSSRIVHFIHGFKNSRLYRREFNRLERLVPKCHLKCSELRESVWSWRTVKESKPWPYRWWMRVQGIR